jgi:hypothetical protein
MRYVLLLAEKAANQGKTEKGYLQVETYYYMRKPNWILSKNAFWSPAPAEQ